MSATTTTTKKTATKDQIAQAQEAVDTYQTKSGAIRALAAAGFSQGDIARALTAVFYPDSDKFVRPQHVSNVLRQAKDKK